MNAKLTFVLLHSPLVGPLTWQLVHSEMKQRGIEVIAPTLTDRPNSPHPFWQQHAQSVVEYLSPIPEIQHIVLVAHSGAGPLLPIIRQSAVQPIGGYVFVDAGIPRNNSSRIDLMSLQNPQWAEQFYRTLLQGSTFPTWGEAELRDIIPDEALRRKMVAEINPRSLSFFTEPIPVFSAWPDAPCAYIKFSAPYNWDFEQAKAADWYVRAVKAGHFHMLLDPSGVTNLIVEAIWELREQGRL